MAASTPTTSIQSAAHSDTQKLLLFQQQLPTAELMATEVAAIDALPFDGIVFTIPSMHSFRGDVPLSYEHLMAELLPAANAQRELRRVRSNFVHVRLVQVNPFTTQVETLKQSLGNLARAARDAGITGIVYDNEDYTKDTWPPEFACPGADLVTCRAEAKQAGAAIMAAMIAEWPDIQVMTTLGPFYGDQTIFRELLGEEPTTGHLVIGAFATGMAEATDGTAARYIDGGEAYFIHTAEQAAEARMLRATSFPRYSDLVSEEMRPHFADLNSLAFSLYDEQGGTPERWRDDIAIALNAADDFAWAFSYHHVWIGEPGEQKLPATRAWYDATIAGRTAAAIAPLPRLTSTTSTVISGTSAPTTVGR